MKFLRKSINIDSSARKFYLIFSTVIISFFILFFIEGIAKIEILVELFIASLLALFSLMFSQFFLRNLLKLNKLKIKKISIWYLIEVLFVALLWTAFDYFDGKTQIGFSYVFINNFLGFLISSVLPYFSFIGIVAFQDRNKIENLIQADKSNEDHNGLISFPDENNIVRLAIHSDQLLFIQSSDNYVELCYLDEDETKKFLLRNTIKKLEKTINNIDIIRCHRSFMINIKNINRAQKTSSGFILKIKSCSSEIPVSKSYVSEIKKHIPTHIKNLQPPLNQ